jgi:hypothetical protein
MTASHTKPRFEALIGLSAVKGEAAVWRTRRPFVLMTQSGHDRRSLEYPQPNGARPAASLLSHARSRARSHAGACSADGQTAHRVIAAEAITAMASVALSPAWAQRP